MTTSVTYQSLDTGYSADSVEWCPIHGNQDMILCGTYQLEDQTTEKDVERTTPQVRVGRLYVHTLENQSNTRQLKQWTSLDMPGILDIKWSNQSIGGDPCFGLVNSVGQLKLFRVHGEERSISMITETQVGQECLGLSLDWNNMLGQREETSITVSDSTGNVHVFSVGEGRLEPLASWTAHDFEAWITAFDQWNTNVVLSGGDDCKLKVWDLRMGTTMPALTSKRHTMGVCSIQSNPIQEHILATGSYDEQLLVWDSRQMKRPITELGLGGGIWRIKWEPHAAKHILTATMYNGFHIIDTADIQGKTPAVKCHYTEHQSIAYGADWCRIPEKEQPHAENQPESQSNFTIGTCSFYDNLLKLWSYRNVVNDT